MEVCSRSKREFILVILIISIAPLQEYVQSYMQLNRGVHPPEAFPPCFRFRLFSKNFPTLWKIFKILHTLCVFRFPPYFDHDAFMHHPMQVLDAPAIEQSSITLTLWSGQVLEWHLLD